MGKKKRRYIVPTGRQQELKPVETKVVVKREKEPETLYIKPENTTRVFIYDALNAHGLQRTVWGEAKEGIYGRAMDYELKIFPESLACYAERKFGEYIPGKAYDLTDEQLKATDKYYTKAYKRETIVKKVGSDIEIYTRRSA